MYWVAPTRPFTSGGLLPGAKPASPTPTASKLTPVGAGAEEIGRLVLRDPAVLVLLEPAPDGLWHRRQSRHEQRHWSIADVHAALERQGLRCLATVGQRTGAVLEPEPDEASCTKTVYVAARADLPAALDARCATCDADVQSAGFAFAEGGTPTWAVTSYWAPEIHQLKSGLFALVFTARDANGVLCIGVATSTVPSPKRLAV